MYRNTFKFYVPSFLPLKVLIYNANKELCKGSLDLDTLWDPFRFNMP